MRVEAGEDLIWSTELYYRLAVLTGNQLDVGQERNRKTVLEIIDKGLSFNEQDRELLYYKAWVLKKGGLLEQALAIYQALEEKNDHSDVVLRGIADIYYEDLNRHADKALTYYERLLEIRENAKLYFYAATCKRQLGELEGAKLYYLKALEMDPGDIETFHGLAFIYDALGNYEESLKLLNQGLAIIENTIHRFDPIVEHKANVLCRLGRFEEALSFTRDAGIDYLYFNFLQLQIDICCQAGWWNRARQVLNRWKRANRNGPEPMPANIRLYLLQGKLFKAALAIESAKHKLPFRQVQDFQLQLAELEQNYPRQVELLSQWVQADPTDDHALTRLALAYWHMDNQKAAQDAAQKALTLLDNTLSQRLTDEPLYRSRRSLILAILGKTQEAKAELSRTRTLPLCHFCAYSSCKDADIYEAQIEEILGNTEKAQKLYTAGRAKWPDDLDCIAGELRLKKKGRK
jgi:tetratricopeptide (TPR) repeat protein